MDDREEKYKALQDEYLDKWIKEIDPVVKIADLIGSNLELR
jgi:hypothetical protein